MGGDAAAEIDGVAECASAMVGSATNSLDHVLLRANTCRVHRAISPSRLQEATIVVLTRYSPLAETEMRAHRKSVPPS